MLCLDTSHPALRNFWYPVALADTLTGKPMAFTLLGEAIALWRVDDDTFGAVADRCPHRSTKLSIGVVRGGNIACAYHGWEYDGKGACKHIPQYPGRSTDHVKVKSYKCRRAYGYVWVCMGEPAQDVPYIPEAFDNKYFQFHEFLEIWKCSGLRVMENGFDNAHFSFVHTGTFGATDPTPQAIDIREADYGFDMRTVIPVKNPAAQQANLGIAEEETTRTIEHNWFMPFGRRMQMCYPTGLVHTIINWATPIDNANSLFIQFVYRNDEGSPIIADLIAWDRAVTLEDKQVLEATDPCIPLEPGGEAHIASDRPGILMRKKIKALMQR
jgi:phenylpropionate dioxygenase-like ring-hydroxylating dioxygenase large terminal subunit